MIDFTLRYNASADEDNYFRLYNEERSAAAIEKSIERLCALRKQELHYDCADYLGLGTTSIGNCVDSSDTRNKACKPSVKVIDIDEECIATMSQWCFEVIDHYGFSRETAQVALNCLNRFLSTKTGKQFLISRSQYQLASMSCLYIAIKVHERVELEASAFVLLSRSSYSIYDIFDTERKVLTALHWRINPPTTSSFVREMIRVLAKCSISIEALKSIYNLSLHQTEIASCTYQLSVHVPPSVIAVASIWNAIQLHSKRSNCIDQSIYSELSKTLGSDFLESEVLASSQSHLMKAVLKRQQNTLAVKDGPDQTSCRSTLVKASSCSNRSSRSLNNHSSPVAVVSPK